MDWIEKIKEVANNRGWTIKQLAGDLGVSQQFLNDVVNGKKPIPPMLKIKILDRLSYEITNELIIDILPEGAADALRELIKKRQSVSKI
jgi:transcriptional regulator with XRE-family HTH domain